MRDINILLMGESGVGKSTLINSIANYIRHDNFNDARTSRLRCLIPMAFTVVDEDYQERIVSIDADEDNENENAEIGQSSTQATKTYTIDGDGLTIRLIDTPGMGDSRGIAQDRSNINNVLQHLNRYEKLHAICILLRPDVTVISSHFKYCLMNLLFHLERSARENIIFVFTKTRVFNYTPGSTLPNLRSILQEVESQPPHVRINCTRQNIFCFENEGFRYLAALRNGVPYFDHNEVRTSWERSAQQFTAMLMHIEHLNPHRVENSILLNTARKYATISGGFLNNNTPIRVFTEEYENRVIKIRNGITELKKVLYVPCIDVIRTDLTQPIRVCASAKCSSTFMVDGVKKMHYPQKCRHQSQNLFESSFLNLFFKAFSVILVEILPCVDCQCYTCEHINIHFDTELRESKVKDGLVEMKIHELEKSFEELMEQKIIERSFMRLELYLQDKSILLHNQAYVDYLDMIIESLKITSAYEEAILYTKMKEKYETEAKILRDALSTMDGFYSTQLPDDIAVLLVKLSNLKHFGRIFSQHNL